MMIAQPLRLSGRIPRKRGPAAHLCSVGRQRCFAILVELDMNAASRTTIFISYSHHDLEWLTRLQVHLAPLEREYGIEVWDDTRIEAGSIWQESISRSLTSARVAVILVSADFLASRFIALNELPPLLSA